MSTAAAPESVPESGATRIVRVRAHVTGVVQGVGFRPFVHRAAGDLALGGWVENDGTGVVIEAEGPAGRVQELVSLLSSAPPPRAAIAGVTTSSVPVRGATGFEVRPSRDGPGGVEVAPDAATCDACLAELFDPADRRHRYPFLNCTDCGPRFTIVTGVPYDRERTTMAGFRMCAQCRAEYEDPADRRFHAEPNACPRCGPAVRLVDARGIELEAGPHEDAVSAAAAMLRDGRILAIKGIGGFHLACRADDEGTVAELRSRKRREEKPFALMARDAAAAAELAELGDCEVELLGGPERPIVLAPRRPDARVARSVAPASPDLGVMLPYSPLHHLLAADVATPLVMTSGNVSDEPIAFRDADALARLAGLADAFLLSDRPIHARADDSVVRSPGAALRGAPLTVRRSRGYAPRSIELPVACERPVLGCGAELKGAFCLARDRRAWVSPHIGDLTNWETLSSFRDGVEHFQRLFATEPAIAAHDLHPDYLATRFAAELEGAEEVGVQHHHAHLASCLAEHGETDPAVGAIFDGSGYGPDGTVWGGEILAGDLAGFERAAHLTPVPLPGGDAAVREPWRMAAAWMAAALHDPLPPIPPALRGQVGAAGWEAVCRLAADGVNAPLTSSAGRLFDAVAALCGLRARVSFEGQAAVELEGIADRHHRDAYPLPVRGSAAGSGPAELDARETIRAVAGDLAAGAEAPLVAARFHNALGDAAAAALAQAAGLRGVEVAVLSGGVFQNRLLLERTALALRGLGLRVLIPARLPPNDGGLAYGQVAVAAARGAAA